MQNAVQIPEVMKAAAIDEFGPPEKVIHIEQLRVPKPGDRQILIQVEMAGVGNWDPDIVTGEFLDTKPHFPRVLGSDGEGTVVAVGPRVRRFSIGDRVYGWGLGNPKGGFYAEYAAIPETMAAPIPNTVKPREAGALAVDGITALEGLEYARILPGKALMIFGASGGIGHLAVQLAKRLEARVFAVASGPDGVKLVERLGADRAVDGHRDDVAKAAHEFSPSGYHAALVASGRDGWERELKNMRHAGRVVYPHGVEPEPKAPRGVRVIGYDGEPHPDKFNRLNELIGKGPFHVELYRSYPLEELPRALHDVRAHHLGKLAVQVKNGVTGGRR